MKEFAAVIALILLAIVVFILALGYLVSIFWLNREQKPEIIEPLPEHKKWARSPQPNKTIDVPKDKYPGLFESKNE